MTQRAPRPNSGLTVAEFEKMPESYGRYELIDGKVQAKPVPKFSHSRISDRIRIAYFKFDPDETLGVMAQEVAVWIRDDYSPAPDLSFWVKSRVPEFNVATAPRPDLAIEIQSPDQSLKILSAKAIEYIRAGVQIVWIIQPNKKIAAVFHQGSTRPITVQPNGELNGEDVIPGFSLKLSDLFR